MIDVELLRQEELIGMINDFEVSSEMPHTAAGTLPVRPGMGDTKNWDIKVVQRDIDTFEGKYSPAGTRKMTIIKNQTAALVKTFKSTFVPGQILIDLRLPGGNQRQVIAQNKISEESQEQVELIRRQDEFLIQKALLDDLSITIDDIAHDVQYFLPATHKLLSVGGGGGNTPLSWADPGADVVADIRRWKTLISEDSGFTPTTVWTSDEVIECLIKNDFVAQYFASTQAGTEFLREGTMSRFMGLNWKTNMQTYVDANDVVQRYQPANEILMLPNPNGSWGEFFEGSDVIPTDDKLSMHEVSGMYAYSSISENPPAIALYIGKVRLPIIKRPNAILRARVIS